VQGGELRGAGRERNQKRSLLKGPTRPGPNHVIKKALLGRRETAVGGDVG
jgi:hypothetical protein